jgi:hypothetical protein
MGLFGSGDSQGELGSSQRFPLTEELDENAAHCSMLAVYSLRINKFLAYLKSRRAISQPREREVRC